MPDNKPSVAHYDRGKLQLVDFLEMHLSPEAYRGYLKGQVFKYLFRYEHKGTPEADLIKAQTYLGWLSESVRREATAALGDERSDRV